MLVLVLLKRRIFTFGYLSLSELSSRSRIIGHLYRLLGIVSRITWYVLGGNGIGGIRGSDESGA